VHSELVEYLRAKAKRCRELGESASDDEAARVLSQLAEDLDAASDAFALASEEQPANLK
jgi:hypothetical protein